MGINTYYQNTSDILQELLEDYCEKQKFDDSKLLKLSKLLTDKVENQLLKIKLSAPFCDFQFYFKLFTDVCNNNISVNNLEKKLHWWEKIKLLDKCLEATNNIDENYIQKSSIINSTDKPIIYLDLNMIIYYIDDQFGLKEKINNSKDKYIYCISPSHLNEIVKLKDERRKQILSEICTLTRNTAIYSVDGILNLVKKDFDYIQEEDYGINELYDLINLSEEDRILKFKDKDLYFEKYNTLEFKREINNFKLYDLEKPKIITKDEINKLLLQVNCTLTLDNMKKQDLKNHNIINHIIYSLCDIFNVLSYKIDKKCKSDVYKKIKSSAHDIEHIKYASMSNIFVTNDQRVKCRAEQIYKFLGIKTKIIDKDEFINFLNS